MQRERVVSWTTAAVTVLENAHALLRPIVATDRQSLHAIAMDPDIWRYFVTLVETDADFDALFDGMIEDHRTGRRAVYHITDKHSGLAAGSMSFGNLAEADSRLEIGWSWLGREFRGRGVNRWAKYLLMEQAFERMDAERVEFKTDRLNVRARHALVNIGAAEEGMLRSYNAMPGGRRRDAVFYSVLRAEWPRIKAELSTRAKVGPAGAVVR